METNPMSDFRTPTWLLGPGRAPSDLRVSDAERQAVADQLSKHFADGRLDQAEFDERLSQAMSAKTYHDLDGLLTDLPSTEASGGAGLPPAGGRVTGRAAGSVPQRRVARPLLLIVAAIVVLSIAGHAAAWAFGGWLWITVIILVVVAFARRSRRTHHTPEH
jgi:Domain of unknown function (DUF1707)